MTLIDFLDYEMLKKERGKCCIKISIRAYIQSHPCNRHILSIYGIRTIYLRNKSRVLNHCATGAQLVASVEIGLEQGAYVVFIYIFSSFEHAKTC